MNYGHAGCNMMRRLRVLSAAAEHAMSAGQCLVCGRRTAHRRYSKVVNRQSPEDVANMPTYQYASETAKAPVRRIYVWGFAQYGALGIADYVRPVDKKRPLKQQHRPAKLTFVDKLEPVVDVASGYGFTLFAVNSKKTEKTFGMGLNSDSQIGYHAPRRGNPLHYLIKPAPIALPLKSPQSTKVKQVACGRAHSVVLTDNEGVFSLGNNAYGQCGRPTVENEDYKNSQIITRVRLEGNDIEQVSCSQDNTFFITKSGDVLACGWGADGQIGNGRYENVGHPQRVKGDIEGERIVQVSSKADCVLALSDKGDVFGWGNSEYGQLSSITTNQQGCGKIVQVASAGTMCAVVNSNGQVYVWGYGLLGKGPQVQHSARPTEIPSTLFGKNQFNPDVQVAKLDCGLNHFVAITNKGDVYSWGRNKMSCLGLGNDQDQYFPLRVAVPARAVKVSCGVDHTVALCHALG